jgi:hypothetical protein
MAGWRAITTTDGKKKNMTGGVEANSTLIVQMHNLMHMAHKVGGCKKVLEEEKNLSCAILFRICCRSLWNEGGISMPKNRDCLYKTLGRLLKLLWVQLHGQTTSPAVNSH